MPMRHADSGKNPGFDDRRQRIRAAMQQAINSDDQKGFSDSFDEMMQLVAEQVAEEHGKQITSLQETIDSLEQTMDAQILTARGVRQLTKDEKTYWQKFGEAAGSDNAKQAVTNLDLVMPKTVINSVFEDLRENHPLLSAVDFVNTEGAVRMIMNTDGRQEAAWGTLCAEIVKELTSGFKEVNATLFKLSAFLPVCKAMLDLGPEWLDRYVREILYEAIANGWEAAIVSGDGKNKPIGMNRQVGEGVSVTDGVYPEKAKVSIKDLYPETIGNLLAQLAVAPNGKTRQVTNVIMVVNPVDYFLKLMPSTTVAGADGSYKNDVMPYPVKIITSPSVAEGEARFGLGKRYFAAAGTATNGKIEYSDDYRFLEDERVYLIKGYGNGMPKDNTSFLNLDISGLKPTMFRAVLVEQSA